MLKCEKDIKEQGISNYGLSDINEEERETSAIVHTHEMTLWRSQWDHQERDRFYRDYNKSSLVRGSNIKLELEKNKTN